LIFALGSEAVLRLCLNFKCVGPRAVSGSEDLAVRAVASSAFWTRNLSNSAT
jgi:hypothetical protein